MMSVYAYIDREIRRFGNEEDGTTLVEFALAIWIFLLIFLGSIDFGRFLAHYYHAERAMHVGARVAVVRPPACAGVPEFHEADTTGGTSPRYGTACRAGNTCNPEPTISCAGDASNATAAEIWGLVGGAFPQGTTISNLRFTYAYDENLGFLGGPYTPEVSVELTNVRFRFISPLGKFGEQVGAAPSPVLDDYSDADGVRFPPMGVTMPGEDLNLGTGG